MRSVRASFLNVIDIYIGLCWGDLTGDVIADERSVPFDRISVETIYRGLYHFYVAHHKGLATDPVKYFAAPANQDLGVLKSVRKPFKKFPTFEF